ncbi:MAG: PDZ domain-containing protein [bacterium]
MKKNISIAISLMILMTFLSCEINNTNQKPETKSKIKSDSDPVRYISMGFEHAMGFSIEKKDAGVFVSSIQELGIAATQGLFDGAKIISIDGFDPMKLDEQSKNEIVNQLENGKCSLIYSYDTDLEKSITLEVNRSNCPQKRTMKYFFVSDTAENQPPSILIIDLAATINKLDFKRETVNFIQFYNSELDEWWNYDEEVHGFSVDADIENISSILSPGFKIDSSQTDKSGSFNYDGKNEIELKYDILTEFDYRGFTQIGRGNLKSKDHLFNGYVSATFEEQFFILPLYKKIESLSYKKLADDQMPITEKVNDWIVLFDKTGGLLELSVDGASQQWFGAYLPAKYDSTDSDSLLTNVKSSGNLVNGEYVELNSIEISWLYDTTEGWEGDPYPVDMSIAFPDDFAGKIELKSFTPFYFQEKAILFTYVPLSGKLSVENGADVQLSGFVMRMR